MALSLISLNIERNKHLKRVKMFLKEQAADAVCLQEVFEHDKPLIEALGYHWNFLPMTLEEYSRGFFSPLGVAICSKVTPIETKKRYYHKPSEALRRFDMRNIADTMWHGIIGAVLPYESAEFMILTTHFTWTLDGLPTDRQHENMKNLLTYVKNLPPHVLCGDFNIPRGYNDVYKKLTEVYADAVPTRYASSIDLSLHRKGDDPIEGKRMSRFMVDYIFTQPSYSADAVELVSGVSDHCAITATLTKT